jgi:hypothetical protein
MSDIVSKGFEKVTSDYEMRSGQIQKLVFFLIFAEMMKDSGNFWVSIMLVG